MSHRPVRTAIVNHPESHRLWSSEPRNIRLALAAGFTRDEVNWMLVLGEEASATPDAEVRSTLDGHVVSSGMAK
jgi:hypothetical protein